MAEGHYGYSFTDLMKLWSENGGNPLAAPIAAAIAWAESGGDPKAMFDVTKPGDKWPSSTDFGLWARNSKAYGGTTADFDPVRNVKWAIQTSKNGTDWRAWCTAYSDNACGKKNGSYLGNGSNALRILKQNGGGSYTGTVPPGASNSGVTTSGGGSQGGTGGSGGSGGTTNSGGGTSATNAGGVIPDFLGLTAAAKKAGWATLAILGGFLTLLGWGFILYWAIGGEKTKGVVGIVMKQVKGATSSKDAGSEAA